MEFSELLKKSVIYFRLLDRNFPFAVSLLNYLLEMDLSKDKHLLKMRFLSLQRI